jgi:hypothetical protein
VQVFYLLLLIADGFFQHLNGFIAFINIQIELERTFISFAIIAVAGLIDIFQDKNR